MPATKQVEVNEHGERIGECDGCYTSDAILNHVRAYRYLYDDQQWVRFEGDLCEMCVSDREEYRDVVHLS